MKKLPIITLAVVTALVLFQFVREVNATAYSNTSVITVAVNESTVFAGPGAWSPSAAAPGSTYGPTTGSMSWNTNADTYNLQVSKNANLTDNGSNTITLHAGTVAAPTALSTGEAWGFSLSNAVGGVNDNVAAIWNNGLNYAGPANSAETVYSSNTAETTGNTWSVLWKAITLASTESGTYTCTVTWTFTTTP